MLAIKLMQNIDFEDKVRTMVRIEIVISRDWYLFQ